MEDTDESPQREIEGPYKVSQFKDSSWVLSWSKSHLGRPFYFNTLTGESVWKISELELKKARQLLGSFPEPTGSPMTETDISKMKAHTETGPQNIIPGRTINNQYVGQQYGYPISYYGAPPSSSNQGVKVPAPGPLEWGLCAYGAPPQPAQFQGFPSIPPLPQAVPHPPFPQTPFQMLPPQLAAPIDIDPAMENIRRIASVQRTTRSICDRFTEFKDNVSLPVPRSNIRFHVNPTTEPSTSQVRARVADSDNQGLSTHQGIENPTVWDSARHYSKSQEIVACNTSLSREINVSIIPTDGENISSSLEFGDNIVLDHRGLNNDVQNRINYGPRKTRATSICDLRQKILYKRKEREKIQNAASNYDRTMENNIINPSINSSAENIIEDNIPPRENSKDIEDNDTTWIAENSYKIGSRVVFDVTELKKNARCVKSQVWLIVADTNVYILNRFFLQMLVESDDDCRLLLVQEVSAELDAAARSARDPVTEELARSAIRMVERLLKAGKAVEEQNVLRRSLDMDCPILDDQILKTCIRFMQKNYRVVFLTNDKLLKLKALSTINAFTIKELKEFLTLYKKHTTDDNEKTPIVITINNSIPNDQLAGPGTMENSELENEDCISHSDEFDEDDEHDTGDDGGHIEPELSKSMPVKPQPDSDEITKAITGDTTPAKQSTMIGRDLLTSATAMARSEIPTNTKKKRVIRLKRSSSSDAISNLHPTALVVHKRPFGKWRRRRNATGSTNSDNNTVAKPTVVQANKIDIPAVTATSPFKPNRVGARDLNRTKVCANMPDSLTEKARNIATNTLDKWTTKSTAFPGKKLDTHSVKSDTQSEKRSNMPDNLPKPTSNVANKETTVLGKSTASTVKKTEGHVVKPTTNLRPDNSIGKPTGITVIHTNQLVTRPITIQANNAFIIPVHKQITRAIKSPNKSDSVRDVRLTIPAKISGKFGTKSTDTSTKASVDNNTLDLLNNVRDKIAILSDNSKKEQNAKCSQSASESLASDTSARKSRLAVTSSRFDTLVPESPSAESDFISNSDGASVHSENLSRYLTRTGATKDGAVTTRSNELNSNKMFEVTCPIMNENLKLRCDEFISLYFQIMEEVLSQVLQHDMLSSKVEISPPWTLHEATECLEVIYPETSEIGYAANMLSATLYNNIEDDKGNIKPGIKPSEYMDMFQYGVLLVWTISKDENLRSCDEIKSAIQSLSKLLKEIKQPRSTESLNDHFNDMSFSGNNEDGVSNLPDTESCAQSSNFLSAPASTNCASGHEDLEKKQPTVKFHRSCNVDSDFLKKLNIQKRENELRVSKKAANKIADSPLEKSENTSTSPPKKAKNGFDEQESNSATNGPTITRQFKIYPEFEKKLNKTAHAHLEFDDKNDDEPMVGEYDDNVIDKQLVVPQMSTRVTGIAAKITDNRPIKERLKANTDLYLDSKMDEDDMDVDTEDDHYEKDNYYKNGDLNDDSLYVNQNFDEHLEENDNIILPEFNNNNDGTVMRRFLREVRDTIRRGHTICNETITEIGAAEKLTANRRCELEELIDDGQSRIEDLLPKLNRIFDREMNGPKNEIKFKNGNATFGNIEYRSFVKKIQALAIQLHYNLSDTSEVLKKDFNDGSK